MKELPKLIRTVRCPVCGTTWRAEVSFTWYTKEVHRTFGYPEQTCSVCLKLADAIRRGEESPSQDKDLTNRG